MRGFTYKKKFINFFIELAFSKNINMQKKNHQYFFVELIHQKNIFILIIIKKTKFIFWEAINITIINHQVLYRLNCN